MLWAPGAGQSLFVMHPVTWGVQAWAQLSTRAAIAGGSFLSAFTRAGTLLAPCRVRLASLHSWEKEICVYFPGSGGQVTPFHPSLLQHSWGFLEPHPKLGIPVWGLEHLGLGVVPPSTAQMLGLLSCWVMALFSPSILFPTFWC